jgi:hypothetical protein
MATVRVANGLVAIDFLPKGETVEASSGARHDTPIAPDDDLQRFVMATDFKSC